MSIQSGEEFVILVFFFLKLGICCLDDIFAAFDRSVEGAAGLVGRHGAEQVCLIFAINFEFSLRYCLVLVEWMCDKMW